MAHCIWWLMISKTNRVVVDLRTLGKGIRGHKSAVEVNLRHLKSDRDTPSYEEGFNQLLKS